MAILTPLPPFFSLACISILTFFKAALIFSNLLLECILSMIVLTVILQQLIQLHVCVSASVFFFCLLLNKEIEVNSSLTQQFRSLCERLLSVVMQSPVRTENAKLELPLQSLFRWLSWLKTMTTYVLQLGSFFFSIGTERWGDRVEGDLRHRNIKSCLSSSNSWRGNNEALKSGMKFQLLQKQYYTHYKGFK